MPALIALLLVLLSIAVLTVILDRGRCWLQWWRQRRRRSQRWHQLLSEQRSQATLQLEDWDEELAFGEPLLQAAGILAPLLGLTGTVFGVMEVLARLGPQLVLPANSSLQGYGRVLLSTALGLLLALLATAALLLNQQLRGWQLRRLERQLRRTQI
ncbi:MAG: MotA/TolQ/ExbB proton channel family protein [Synechococcaceae cyanobacterium]|nr:MotA/TolQ/ExbB proton channel family protein [Synechococcaceae cyanobacterium]